MPVLAAVGGVTLGHALQTLGLRRLLIPEEVGIKTLFDLLSR